MIMIAKEVYNVLYAYLMGDSRKNELYIAKSLDFFENEILREVGVIRLINYVLCNVEKKLKKEK